MGRVKVPAGLSNAFKIKLDAGKDIAALAQEMINLSETLHEDLEMASRSFKMDMQKVLRQVKDRQIASNVDNIGVMMTDAMDAVEDMIDDLKR